MHAVAIVDDSASESAAFMSGALVLVNGSTAFTSSQASAAPAILPMSRCASPLVPAAPLACVCTGR